MFSRLRLSGYYYNNLTLRINLAEMVKHLGETATDMLFVDFRDFAGNRAASVRPKNFGKLFQSLHQTVGRLIENHCPRLFCKGFQSSLASLLLRKKALKAESVAGQTRRHDSRNASGCTRQSLHLNALIGTCTRQKKARVANARRPRIANERHILTGKNLLLNLIGCLVLIELVVGNHRGADFIVLQQHRRCAGIFGKNQVDTLQDIHCPKGHIFQIPNRRGHYVQLASHSLPYCNLRRTAIIKRYTTSLEKFQSL